MLLYMLSHLFHRLQKFLDSFFCHRSDFYIRSLIHALFKDVDQWRVFDCRLFVEVFYGSLSDFPIWDIQYPFEGNSICRITEVSHVGDNILDLFPFKKFECSSYFVGYPFLDEKLFKR